MSALLGRNADSATSKIFHAVLGLKLLPLYNEAIIDEYEDVLRRSKFTFPQEDVDKIINAVQKNGILSERVASGEDFPDSDDAVYYEVALSKEGAYVVTGNLKHFPRKPNSCHSCRNGGDIKHLSHRLLIAPQWVVDIVGSSEFGEHGSELMLPYPDNSEPRSPLPELPIAKEKKHFQ